MQSSVTFVFRVRAEKATTLSTLKLRSSPDNRACYLRKSCRHSKGLTTNARDRWGSGSARLGSFRPT